MSKYKLIVFFAIVVALIFITFNLNKGSTKKIEGKKKNVFKEKTDWDYLQDAIIYVESRGIDTIKGECHSVGCLQITPIYVKEVNIISGAHYTLNDRKNRQKSLEMFEILQKHYNPEKNLLKALRYHNFNSPSKYKKMIFKKINEFKLQDKQVNWIKYKDYYFPKFKSKDTCFIFHI